MAKKSTQDEKLAERLEHTPSGMESRFPRPQLAEREGCLEHTPSGMELRFPRPPAPCSYIRVLDYDRKQVKFATLSEDMSKQLSEVLTYLFTDSYVDPLTLE